MATYTVTHPKTGKTLEITGSRMPNEEELKQIFGQTEQGTPAPKEKLSGKFPVAGTLIGGGVGLLAGPFGVPLGAAAGAGAETAIRQTIDTVRGNVPRAKNMKEAFGQSMENLGENAGNQATAAALGELVTAPFAIGKQLQSVKQGAIDRSVKSGKLYSRGEVFDIAEKDLMGKNETGLLDKLVKKVSNSKVSFGTVPKNAQEMVKLRQDFGSLGWDDKGNDKAGVSAEVARAVYKAINTSLSSKDKTIRAIDALQRASIVAPQKASGAIKTALTAGSILGLLKLTGLVK